MLEGIIFDRVGSFTDLGVVMDSRMSFSRHIGFTVGKALEMLMLVKNCQVSSEICAPKA
jgi:hypothetical protein